MGEHFNSRNLTQEYSGVHTGFQGFGGQNFTDWRSFVESPRRNDLRTLLKHLLECDPEIHFKALGGKKELTLWRYFRPFWDGTCSEKLSIIPMDSKKARLFYQVDTRVSPTDLYQLAEQPLILRTVFQSPIVVPGHLWGNVSFASVENRMIAIYGKKTVDGLEKKSKNR